MFPSRNKITAQFPRSAFTLLELMISLALLSMLSLVTVTGMIFHARMAQSNLAKQRMAEGARRFIEGAQIAMMDATVIRIDKGPAGNGTVLTLNRPDPEDPSKVITKQYAYLDTDGNAATIGDNRIVVRDEDKPLSSEGKMLLEYCSPVSGLPIFSRNVHSPKALYDVNLRVGDRTYPAGNEDNAFTGRGYQSFVIAASLSKI